MIPTRVLPGLVILLLGYLRPNATTAQDLDPELCAAFNKVHELFVIADPTNTTEIPTSDGGSVSFEQAVRNAWPQKTITVIEQATYDNAEEVKERFHASLAVLVQYSEGQSKKDDPSYSIDMMVIQRGKTGRHPKQTVGAVFLDLAGFLETSTGERIEQVVGTMKELVHLPFQGARDTYSYRAKDLRPALREDTLVMRRTDVFDALQKPGKLQEEYPHPFKFVSDEEWITLVRTRPEGYIYLELIAQRSPLCVSVRKADTGHLLFSGYPWAYGGYLRGVGKPFFSKLLKD